MAKQTDHSTPAPTVPGHIVRRIAADAGADPRSVRRVIAGQPTRPLVRERVLRALRAMASEARP